MRHGVLRRRHLEKRPVASDSPAFADPRPCHVDPGRGEVLAEHAVGKGPGQFGFPLVQVFARVDVDGLIVTAVKLLIADGVADQAAAETATHRAGRAHHDLVISRRLVDTGPPRRRIGVRADTCEVHRQHRSHGHSVFVDLRICVRGQPRRPDGTEREVIATVVSGENRCAYCHTNHANKLGTLAGDWSFGDHLRQLGLDDHLILGGSPAALRRLRHKRRPHRVAMWRTPSSEERE